MEPSLLSRADALAAAGQPRAAITLIQNEAESGNPEAQIEVAQWRLFGLYGSRNPGEALALLAAARESGLVSAAKMEATLRANGTAGIFDPATARSILESISAADPDTARQLLLLDHMEARADMARVVLSEDPLIKMIPGLLEYREVEYLIEKATPKLQASFVIDPSSGRRMPSTIRTSSGMNFGPLDEDLVIHALNRRLAAASETDVACGEMLHVLRYAPGEQYRDHVDVVAGADNQRDWTVLVWLNEDYDGGETLFRDLDISVKGRVGDAIVFRNVRSDGTPEPRMRHAGLPVTRGVKWLASRWIRRKPFSPFST